MCQAARKVMKTEKKTKRRSPIHILTKNPQEKKRVKGKDKSFGSRRKRSYYNKKFSASQNNMSFKTDTICKK